MVRILTFRLKFRRLALALRYWIYGASWDEANHVAKSVVYGWNWWEGEPKDNE